MGLVFLHPVAALVGVGALAPLALAWRRERRERLVRRAIAVAAPPLRVRFASAVAAAVVVACLAAAAAQPALQSTHPERVRSDAQIVFVVDVSRSMLASARADTPSRLQRAKALAKHLRDSFPEVPAGIASLTDWLLPHALPTLDRRVFTATLQRVLGIERPRPFTQERNATDFAALFALAQGRYFPSSVHHRVAVVLSDGESRPFAQEPLANALHDGGVQLLVVRLWGSHEAIYDGKRRDPGYAPNPLATAPLEALAAGTAGGRVYSEHERDAIVSRMRALLGKGPVVTSARHPHTTPLAPYAVLAGLLPLGFLLVRR
jgi:hypothetical protein